MMKSYLELVPLSARARRRSSRMTILCIVIAVFLVTAVFSMADMAVRMEQSRLIEKHGSWHVMLRQFTEQQRQQIAQQKNVSALARYDEWMPETCTLNSQDCVILGEDSALLTDIYNDLTEGHYPETGDEVLLSVHTKELLSLEVGDKVTLHTPAGESTYTVCGFGGDAEIADKTDAAAAFLNWDAFCTLADAEGYTPAPVCFVQFGKGVRVRRAIAQMRQTYGFTDDALTENTAMLGLSGDSSNSYVVGMYTVAAFLFVLVLAAGVFMIAGSLNSKTAERTQFFGMLRCIGASRKQIMHIVRLEALYWCRTAVPLGVGAGIVGTWALCALLRFGVGAEFATIPQLGVSAVGVLSGAAVGVLTVLLSSVSPARRAASVSPIAAVSGGTVAKGRVKRPLRQSRLRIETALGIHHAVSSPRNLFLMTGSFALSIIMVLGFTVLTQWVNIMLGPTKPWAPDVFYTSPANVCEIDKSFAAELAAKPYVKRAFGRMYQSLPAEYSGKTGRIDLISYEQQQFQWAEKDLVAGDLASVTEDGGVLVVYNKDAPLYVGDKIRLENATLTVAGVLEDSPFDTTEQPTVICSEAAFTKLTGMDAYAIVDVQLTTKADEQDRKELAALAGQYGFYDRTEQNRDTKNTYAAFCLFVYGFLAVIVLISMIHTVNSISMSAAARTKQYGMMRAVGMDEVQVKRMIVTEAAVYTTLGLVVGCGLGLPLHRLLYTQLITNYRGVAWQVPVPLIGGMLVLLAAVAFLAPSAPAKRVCSMSITSTINEL